MQQFESDYQALIYKVLREGGKRQTRNGGTTGIFGESLIVNMSNTREFPLLQGRRLFYEGVFGELAAFLNGPKCIKDFEDQGCNYWHQWAQASGAINVDYGNKWTDFNGYNQLKVLQDTLLSNPTDRRLIINSWDPSNLENLDLPCCHFLYQWYVRDDMYLDMNWYQRSVDVMVGLPSDIILAAAMNVMLANFAGYVPGRIKMDLGDVHIYDEHRKGVKEYLNTPIDSTKHPTYYNHAPIGQRLESFTASDIDILGYDVNTPIIKFEVKA